MMHAPKDLMCMNQDANAKLDSLLKAARNRLQSSNIENKELDWTDPRVWDVPSFLTPEEQENVRKLERFFTLLQQLRTTSVEGTKV